MKSVFVVLLACLTMVTAFSKTQSRAAALSHDRSGQNTLILDAGHGGEDGGAVSASGAKESDINLGIVLKIDQLMGFWGVPTILTRADDRSIHDASAKTLREKKVSDLHNRVSLIEGTEHSMLVSIHQNSFPDPRYSGAQVFYGLSGQSREWGEFIQEVLRISLDPGNNRAAKPIPDSVYLMNHISCPAVLVECGFMSNGAEASLLVTASYQKKIAAALAGACIQYLNQ